MFDKKKISLLLGLLLILSLILPNTGALAEENYNLTIIGTSDIHGRFNSNEYATLSNKSTGLTKIATYLKGIRNESTVVIDNGDSLQDNYSHLFVESMKKEKKHPVTEAMKEIGYDSFNLGNHEFNFGMDFTKAATETGIPTLCANLYDANGKRVFKPYTIKEVKLNDKETVKLAIIGVVTPHIMGWDAANLKGYNATNPIEETKKVIGEMKAENVKYDLLFISSHMGLKEEYGNGDSAKELATQIPEAIGVLAGHAHQTVNEKVGNVLVMEPKQFGQEVVKFNFTLAKNPDGTFKVANSTGDVVSMKEIKEDTQLAEKLKSFDEIAMKDATTIVGKLEGEQLAPSNPVKEISQGQLQDTALVDLIHKVQILNGSKNIPEGSKIVSGAALFTTDSNLMPGDIKKADSSKVYKFDNTLYTLKVTGKDLKAYMEWSASYFNTWKNGDLTYSTSKDGKFYNYDMFQNVNYTLDLSKEVGSRIGNLVWSNDKTPVKDEDVIYLIVNNYRANSQLLSGKVPGFDSKKVETVWTSGDVQVRDMITEYIKSAPNATIKGECDNNWKIIGTTIDPEKQKQAYQLINDGKIVLAQYNTVSVTEEHLKQGSANLAPTTDAKNSSNTSKASNTMNSSNSSNASNSSIAN